MKRSEMVDLLSIIIHDTRRATDAWTSIDIADKILMDIENNGMLPPSTIEPIKGGYGINDSTHVMKVDGEYVGARRVNRWEPEDE